MFPLSSLVCPRILHSIEQLAREAAQAISRNELRAQVVARPQFDRRLRSLPAVLHEDDESTHAGVVRSRSLDTLPATASTPGSTPDVSPPGQRRANVLRRAGRRMSEALASLRHRFGK